MAIRSAESLATCVSRFHAELTSDRKASAPSSCASRETEDSLLACSVTTTLSSDGTNSPSLIQWGEMESLQIAPSVAICSVLRWTVTWLLPELVISISRGACRAELGVALHIQ